jgi:hypothetical protein
MYIFHEKFLFLLHLTKYVVEHLRHNLHFLLEPQKTKEKCMHVFVFSLKSSHPASVIVGDSSIVTRGLIIGRTGGGGEGISAKEICGKKYEKAKRKRGKIYKKRNKGERKKRRETK